MFLVQFLIQTCNKLIFGDLGAVNTTLTYATYLHIQKMDQ